MTAHLSFFPVGNGDMTLVQTEAGHNILIVELSRVPRRDAVPAVRKVPFSNTG